MVRGSKHCWNLNHKTFTIYINHCSDNSDGKSLSLLYADILGLFVKTLNADLKYYLLITENLKKPIQMQLCQKQRFSAQFVAVFLKSRLNFQGFQQKVTLIANLFLKLPTPKNVFKQMSKNSRFRGTFNKQHGKGDQKMLKSERHQFYNIHGSLWRQVSWKKSLLVICKVLTMFAIILNVDGKCFFLNRDNLRQPIQIRLS